MSSNTDTTASDSASATGSQPISSPFSPHAAAFGPSATGNLGVSNRIHGLSSDGQSLSSRASSFASAHGRALSPAAKPRASGSPFATGPADPSSNPNPFHNFGDRMRDSSDHSRQSSAGALSNLSATSPATAALATRRAPSPLPHSLSAHSNAPQLGARSPNSLLPPSSSSADDPQRRFSASFGAHPDNASSAILDASRPPFARQSLSDGPSASDHHLTSDIASAYMDSRQASFSAGFSNNGATPTQAVGMHNAPDLGAAPAPTTGPLSASDPRTQLLVSNLPYRVRWQDLKDLFRKAGTVLRADVSLSADNRSRGYGTVLMATEQDALKAADMLGGFTWQGRTLDVRVDRSGALVGVAGSAVMPTIAPNNLRSNAMPGMANPYSNGHAGLGHAMPSIDPSGAGQSFLGVPPGAAGSFSGGASPSALSPLARAADASMSGRSSFSHHASNGQATDFERAMLHTNPSNGTLNPAARQNAGFDSSFGAGAPHRAVSALQSIGSRRGSEASVGMSASSSSGGWPAGNNDAAATMYSQNTGGSSVPTGFPGATAMAPWPAPGSFGGNHMASMQSQPFAAQMPTTSYAGRVLFVGNLPFHCQWQDLKDLFRAAGNIQRADVAIGPDGRSRGFGTVLFATQEDAQNAVRLYHGYEYSGRTLKVHFDRFAAQNGPAIGTPGNPAQYTGAFAAAALPSHMTNNVRAPALNAQPQHAVQAYPAQQQRSGAGGFAQPMQGQGAFGQPMFQPADANTRAFTPQQSSLFYQQQPQQQRYGQQGQQQPPFAGFGDADAASAMSGFGQNGDKASERRSASSRPFGLFTEGDDADKQAGRDDEYGMTIAMPASGFGAASSYLPSDLMSPGLVSPQPLSHGNAHPGRIQLPAAAQYGFGGAADGGQARMQVPMTPGMPGFSFNPVPETPPLYPQFLSPGLGPFSPTVGGSSQADAQAGQMQPAMAGFMNAAPGAPVHAASGAGAGYNPMFASYAAFGGGQQPATPHWSQPTGPRRSVAERGSSALSHTEADEVVDSLRTTIAKTPGAGPRRPSHVAMDVGRSSQAEVEVPTRRASDVTPSAAEPIEDGYPFPLVASGGVAHLTRRASTNSPAGTPLAGPGGAGKPNDKPAQPEVVTGTSAEELANTIARLSVKGTALDAGARRSVSMNAERSAAASAMAKLRGQAGTPALADEAGKLGPAFGSDALRPSPLASEGGASSEGEPLERLLGWKVTGSALEAARNGSALDTGSEAGESRKSTPRDEAGPAQA